MKTTHDNWQKTLWRILTNPAIELVATLAVVVVATWYLVQEESARPLLHAPAPFGQK